jgi:hypothetical protein
MNARRLLLAAFAFFVIVFVGSGLLVQHTAELGFDVDYLSPSWAMRLYGDELPSEHRAFRATTGTWAQLGDRTFHDTTPLVQRIGALQGAIAEGDRTYLADETLLWAFGEDDRLEGLLPAPAPIERLSLSRDALPVVATRHGVYQADRAMTAWVAHDAASDDRAAENQQLNDVELATLKGRFLAESITMERLLTDLHTGRLLGRTGAYIVDMLGIALILAATYAVFASPRKNR